ncbi:MAG TPA: tripartite tricarboxylate transporter substrate-binding protein, partial [Burkholderiales bacterium]|nr:tripartite tricarboxylate transporter substrate-binding protein [Burkholderiales bacterium]
PSLMPKLPYDALKDFEPISLVATTTYVLSVHPTMQVATVKDLVALAKSRPGQFTFASAGTGTPNHLSGEMFKSVTGIDIRHVPYKGSAPAMTDVMGGQVTMNFENIAPVLPHVKGGKLKALGITAPQRSPLLPEIPTIAESGYPGFQAVGWFGLLAPAGTPKDVVARVNASAVRALRLPDVTERLTGIGVEIHASSVEAFDAFQKAELAKWAKVIKDAGVRLE